MEGGRQRYFRILRGILTVTFDKNKNWWLLEKTFILFLQAFEMSSDDKMTFCRWTLVDLARVTQQPFLLNKVLQQKYFLVQKLIQLIVFE